MSTGTHTDTGKRIENTKKNIKKKGQKEAWNDSLSCFCPCPCPFSFAFSLPASGLPSSLDFLQVLSCVAVAMVCPPWSWEKAGRQTWALEWNSAADDF